MEVLASKHLTNRIGMIILDIVYTPGDDYIKFAYTCDGVIGRRHRSKVRTNTKGIYFISFNQKHYLNTFSLGG